MQRKSFEINLLSVVIPAYKQEKTIVRDIKNIQKTLDSLGYKYELIVVVDGLIDNTYKNAMKIRSTKIKVIAYEKNEGKGHALRYGMIHAKGNVVGFIDAGMDIHPEGFNMLLSHMAWYDADVIVGSKLHPVSRVKYPFNRTILSWGYRLLTRLLFGFKVRDTQVGMKFFKSKVIKDVLPRLVVKRYAFDIEILAVSYALGYKRIFEAPIQINFNPSNSSIISGSLWRIVGHMVWDTFAVFYRLKILRYYRKGKRKQLDISIDKKIEKNNMKILILNWRDITHPLSGGAEISLLEHARYWKKMGAEVTWFASSYPHVKKEEVIEGIRYIRRGSHFTVHFWAFVHFMKKQFGTPEIIIDSFHFLPFFTPLYYKKGKTIALINEVAGKVWFDNLSYFFAYIGYHIEPYFFKLYKDILFITASDSAKEDLIHVGIPSRNIRIVHHGVRPMKVGAGIKKSRNPSIVFLARVSADKGIKDILVAFKRLRKDIKNVKLWIIGKEEKPGILKKILKESNLSLNKGIVYHGFVNEKKKFELLKKGWLLIHPSKKEGWGINVIEAGIMGSPTIGYKVEGLRDSVKNGETGILVSAGRSDLLAEAAIKLIEDKKLYQKYSENVIKWSSKFTWDNSTKKSWLILKNVYEKNK